MRLPPADEALLRTLCAAPHAFWSRWMRSIAGLPGNPFGAQTATFDGAFGVAMPGRADVHWMNMVEHLYPEHAARVGEITGFFRRAGTTPTFSAPSVGDPAALGRALASAGAHPVRTLSVLYGRASAPLPGPTDASVREIAPEEFGRFAAVWADGYELQETERAHIGSDLSAWPEFADCRYYLAAVDGKPAAAAVLMVRDGMGYLANASTRPAFRRRGAHAALIERRIADAAAAGCDLVCALAVFGTGSQTNMERAGLRIAGTVTQWRER